MRTRPQHDMLGVVPVIQTARLKDVAAFYCDFFDFEYSWSSTDDYEICLVRGGSELRLRHAEAHSTKTIQLILQISDIESSYHRLMLAGAHIGTPLDATGAGGRSFTVLDPTGTELEVVEPVD